MLTRRYDVSNDIKVWNVAILRYKNKFEIKWLFRFFKNSIFYMISIKWLFFMSHYQHANHNYWEVTSYTCCKGIWYKLWAISVLKLEHFGIKTQEHWPFSNSQNIHIDLGKHIKLNIQKLYLPFESIILDIRLNHQSIFHLMSIQ